MNLILSDKDNAEIKTMIDQLLSKAISVGYEAGGKHAIEEISNGIKKGLAEEKTFIDAKEMLDALRGRE